MGYVTLRVNHGWDPYKYESFATTRILRVKRDWTHITAGHARLDQYLSGLHWNEPASPPRNSLKSKNDPQSVTSFNVAFNAAQTSLKTKPLKKYNATRKDTTKEQSQHPTGSSSRQLFALSPCYTGRYGNSLFDSFLNAVCSLCLYTKPLDHTS